MDNILKTILMWQPSKSYQDKGDVEPHDKKCYQVSSNLTIMKNLKDPPSVNVEINYATRHPG